MLCAAVTDRGRAGVGGVCEGSYVICLVQGLRLTLSDPSYQDVTVTQGMDEVGAGVGTVNRAEH